MNDTFRSFVVEAERFSRIQDRISNLKGRQAHVIFPDSFRLLESGNREVMDFLSEARRAQSERELSLVSFKFALKNTCQEFSLDSMEHVLNKL